MKRTGGGSSGGATMQLDKYLGKIEFEEKGESVYLQVRVSHKAEGKDIGARVRKANWNAGAMN